MSLEILETYEALQDLNEIADHLVDNVNIQTAHKVINAIRATFEFLAANYNIGTIYDFGVQDLDGLRMFPVIQYGNYLVFFQSLDKK